MSRSAKSAAGVEDAPARASVVASTPNVLPKAAMPELMPEVLEPEKAWTSRPRTLFPRVVLSIILMKEPIWVAGSLPTTLAISRLPNWVPAPVVLDKFRFE